MSPARVLLIMMTLSACGVPYGGPRCRAITLDTKPSSLPLSQLVPAETRDLRQSDPYILGTHEMLCCVNNPYAGKPSDCSGVDCDALVPRLTKASVRFGDDRCGAQQDPFSPPGGLGVCSVFLEGDKVVGVRAFCFD